MAKIIVIMKHYCPVMFMVINRHAAYLHIYLHVNVLQPVDINTMAMNSLNKFYLLFIISAKDWNGLVGKLLIQFSFTTTFYKPGFSHPLPYQLTFSIKNTHQECDTQIHVGLVVHR